MQGDTRSQWRTEPFQMFEGGPWWVPPDVPFDDEVRERERGRMIEMVVLIIGIGHERYIVGYG